MHEKNTIHNKIIRLFNGEASPNEKREIGDWLNHNTENRKLYTDLQEIWLATGVSGNNDTYNTEYALQKFRERIQNPRRKGFKLTVMMKYAAIVILLLSLPLAYYFGRTTLQPIETFTTITCAYGDKSTITLPDSSVVHLNSGSKLTFNNDFQGDYRMVYLEGEAYFSVNKNKDIPFKVNAFDIEIEVLGTEFNLKAYADENTISTTLAEGSIQISSASQYALLKPNQKIEYDRIEKKMKLIELHDITPETEWKEGRLVFRNESLEELELKLERWFDVDIVLADDEVKKRRFTGILERESILETIAYFSHSKYVGYKIKDNEITFYSK